MTHLPDLNTTNSENDAAGSSSKQQIMTSTSTVSSIKKKTKKATPDVDIDKRILTTLDNMNDNNTRHDEETFGALVGLELSKIQDLQTRNAIKKEIMNLIYSQSFG